MLIPTPFWSSVRRFLCLFGARFCSGRIRTGFGQRLPEPCSALPERIVTTFPPFQWAVAGRAARALRARRHGKPPVGCWAFAGNHKPPGPVVAVTGTRCFIHPPRSARSRPGCRHGGTPERRDRREISSGQHPQSRIPHPAAAEVPTTAIGGNARLEPDANDRCKTDGRTDGRTGRKRIVTQAAMSG